MLQLQNTTPFKATIAVLPDRSGIDTLFVIVKATATLRPTLSLADEQTAPIMARVAQARRAGAKVAATQPPPGLDDSDWSRIVTRWPVPE